MSLLDEARAVNQRHGPPCGVGQFLNHLSDEMRAQVDEVIADPRCTTSALVAALKGRGFDSPAPATWNRHLRGECRCG